MPGTGSGYNCVPAGTRVHMFADQPPYRQTQLIEEIPVILQYKYGTDNNSVIGEIDPKVKEFTDLLPLLSAQETAVYPIFRTVGKAKLLKINAAVFGRTKELFATQWHPIMVNTYDKNNKKHKMATKVTLATFLTQGTPLYMIDDDKGSPVSGSVQQPTTPQLEAAKETEPQLEPSEKIVYTIGLADKDAAQKIFDEVHRKLSLRILQEPAETQERRLEDLHVFAIETLRGEQTFASAQATKVDAKYAAESNMVKNLLSLGSGAQLFIGEVQNQQSNESLLKSEMRVETEDWQQEAVDKVLGLTNVEHLFFCENIASGSYALQAIMVRTISRGLNLSVILSDQDLGLLNPPPP